MNNSPKQAMGRAEHTQIIEKGIKLDERLFAPLTTESISLIEKCLQEASEQNGKEYVAVPVGQPYGGPKMPMGLPKEDVDAAHRAYKKGLRGVSPEIGRAYDLPTERERIKDSMPSFNPDHYPKRFLKFLGSYFKR